VFLSVCMSLCVSVCVSQCFYISLSVCVSQCVFLCMLCVHSFTVCTASLSGETRFSVSSPKAEFQKPLVNDHFLKAVARTTGGTYQVLEEAASLEKLSFPNPRIEADTSTRWVSLWVQWTFLFQLENGMVNQLAIDLQLKFIGTVPFGISLEPDGDDFFDRSSLVLPPPETKVRHRSLKTHRPLPHIS